MSGYCFTPTQFGFMWGPLEIERVCSDERGGVLITLRTSNGSTMDVRATPSGRLRIGAVTKKKRGKQ